MKRAALYVRVSTQEQKLHGMSVDNQIEALQQYCEDHGYQIAGLYNDAGISGSKSYRKRPALLQMMADCRSGMIDIVLFTRLDRFFRSVKDYYECIAQMNNVPWQAIWEDYETISAEGKFKTNIMLSVAQSESDRTAARLRDSYQYRKAKGIYIGRPPVGYILENGRLLKDPETRDGVQAAFNTYIRTLSTAKALDAALDHGLTFSRSYFAKIMKSPTYAGTTPNGHKCEPYITEEQHEFIMTVKKSRKVKSKSRVYIFSGVCVCGYCGRRLVGKTRENRVLKNGRIVTYARYTCQGDLSTTNRCPRHLEISCDKLEAVMLATVDDEIRRLRYSLELENRDIQDKLRERKRLEQKLDRIKELYIDGDIDKERYVERKAKIEREISLIQVRPAAIPELPKEWKEIYSSLTPENRQLFWKKIIDKVIITNENKNHPQIFFRV